MTGNKRRANEGKFEKIIGRKVRGSNRKLEEMIRGTVGKVMRGKVGEVRKREVRESEKRESTGK